MPESSENKAPIPKVLEISESMALVELAKDNGAKTKEYIGEIDNRSYPVYEFATYDPQEGLFINGQNNKSEFLSLSDLIKLKHGFGYLSVKEFLGNKELQLTDRAFDYIFNKAANEWHNIQRLIVEIVRAFNLDWREIEDMDNVRRSAHDLLAQYYRPWDFISVLLDYLQEKAGRELSEKQANELKNYLDGVKKIGLFSSDPETRKQAIVDYFYLLARVNNWDLSDVDKIRQVFARMPLYIVERLLKEYKHNPGPRFSSNLLVACKQEIEENGNEYNLRDY